MRLCWIGVVASMGLSLACVPSGTIGGALVVDDDRDGASPMPDGGSMGARDGAVLPATDASPETPDAGESSTDASEPDGGVVVTPDAGQCSDRPLADRLTLTPLTGVGNNAMAFPLASGGVLIGARGGSGIELSSFDASGNTSGSPISVSGDGLWGVAASSDAYAALISRDDVLALVVVSSAGAPIADHTIMGGVPHDVTNNEWFGSQLRAGRLDWDGQQWIAYATVQRLWPDGIAHYGDTLRTFAPDGTPDRVYWDWGCSHSIDVRLAHNADGVAPVCSSDCYPGKGVFFMHNTTVFNDSSGNCAGFVAQELGGIASLADGFMVGFVSAEGRSSKDPALAHVGNDGRVGPIVWLADDAEAQGALHLARYGDGLIAAFTGGGAGHLLELDAAGAPRGSESTVGSDVVANADDFFTLPDGSGDVGWLTNGRWARLTSCR